MSDPLDSLYTILRDLAKKTEAPSIQRKVADLVKENMAWWAEIDGSASFEWAREDVSNYTPGDVDALLDEMKDVWADEMLSWMDANAIARDHSEDEHDMRWR